MAPGRGLFVAVDSDADVDRVEIPEGTLISGYSKVGSWAPRWEGDKAVSCSFSKVLSMLTFYSKYSRELSFENFFIGMRLTRPTPPWCTPRSSCP